MIDDLDNTLEVLRKREMPPSLVDQLTSSFAVPDDQFPPQSVTLPAITLQPKRLQSMGVFWQAVGGKPKAALNFTVTGP